MEEDWASKDTVFLVHFRNQILIRHSKRSEKCKKCLCCSDSLLQQVFQIWLQKFTLSVSYFKLNYSYLSFTRKMIFTNLEVQNWKWQWINSPVKYYISSSKSKINSCVYFPAKTFYYCNFHQNIYTFSLFNGYWCLLIS